MGNDASDYIQTCFAQGVVNFGEIAAKARARIEEIDKELAEADRLRAEKVKLTNVLRELHDDSVKRHRAVPTAPAIELDDNGVPAQKLRYQICKVIGEDGALLNNDLMQKVCGYQEQQRFIRAVKFLGEKGILSRDEERRHVPGPNWNERPIEDPEENSA
jgi:hypothetical protein